MAKTALELALELAEIFDKRKELDVRETQIRQELNQLQSVVEDMNKPIFTVIPPNPTRALATNSFDNTNWNATWKIDKKTANILRRTKRLMYNREVAEYVAGIETNNDPDYIKMLVRKFSAVVGGKAKNGRVFNRVEIDGVLYYGLADWFAADGKAKPEYLPTE